MVGENLTEIIYNFPPELVSRISSFLTVVRALGIVAIIYILFHLINMILNRKKRNELRKINSNLEEIKRI